MKEDQKIAKKSDSELDFPIQELPSIEQSELDRIRKQASDNTYAVGMQVQSSVREGICDGAQRLQDEVAKTRQMFLTFVDRISFF